MAKSTAPIKKYAVEMTKANIDKEFKHKTCQFAGNKRNSERYCTMTTNRSCNNCTFYDPEIGAVLEAMAGEIERAQTAKREFNRVIKELEGDIKEVMDIQDDMENLRADAKREYSKLYIAKHDMVELWQNSVNSYE